MWYHVGPHGYYDLVRLARRGRTAIVRVAYVLVLFAALAVVYYGETNGIAMESRKMKPAQDRFAEVVNRNARIAERFSMTILVMQNIAVLLLMPVYIASSLQEERDRATLPILFTTHLTARMIVLGKWLSRVGHVGSVLLAGLPILAFAQLWGGIDMPMIAVNFGNTAMLTMAVGALSMSIAVLYRGVIKAVAMSYFVMTGLSIGCTCPLGCLGSMPGSRGVQNMLLLTPYTSETQGYEVMAMLAGMLALLYAAGAAFFLLRASRDLNRERTEEPAPPPDEVISGITARRNRWWRFPPIGDDAVAWKERHLDASLWIVTPIAILPMIFLHIWVCLIAWWAAGPSAKAGSQMMADLAPLWILYMLVGPGIYILLVSFRLASCLVRERQQQTLESLLTVPLTQREFLWAKVRGNLLRYRYWLLPFAFVWPIIMLVGFPVRLYGCVLLLAVPIHLAFFAMLGLFLSVLCRTTVAAYMSLGVVVFGLVIGTLFGPIALRGDASLFLSRSLNPVGFWINLCLEPSPHFNLASPGPWLALSAYAAGAYALWVATCRLFARNPCGT